MNWLRLRVTDDVSSMDLLTRPSLSSRQQVNHPATPDMRPFTSAVGQDVVVVATGVLKGIGQDRQPVKSTRLVNALGKCDDGRREPRGIDDDTVLGADCNLS